MTGSFFNASNFIALLSALGLHAAALFVPSQKSAPAAFMQQGIPGELEVELVDSPSGKMVEPEISTTDASEPEPAPMAPAALVAPPPVPASTMLAEPAPSEEEASRIESPPEKRIPAKTSANRPLHQATPPRSGSGQGGVDRTSAAPDYLRNPPPVYPSLSRKAGEEGRVLLFVRVTEVGKVADLQIRQTSGHQRLDQAAINAVRRWRFKAAEQNGRNVSSEVEVPITFSLE